MGYVNNPGDLRSNILIKSISYRLKLLTTL